jgi:hypothetical protein
MKTSTAWTLFAVATLIIAALTWPARSGDTKAPFVKPVAPTPAHRIFPPAQYDHYYEGDLTIKIVNSLEELHEVCQLDNPQLLACSTRNEWSCIIVLVKDEVMRKRSWTTGMLLRHEIGHCNGWGADHAGERSISWPTIHWAHPNARVKLAR